MRGAALTIGLLTVGLATWLVLIPRLGGTASATMANRATGQRVVCQASAIPADKAAQIVSLCCLSCEERGFYLIPGQAVAVPDFASADAAEHAMSRFAHLFPTACMG
jgi:hypothetical protein